MTEMVRDNLHYTTVGTNLPCVYVTEATIQTIAIVRYITNAINIDIVINLFQHKTSTPTCYIRDTV